MTRHKKNYWIADEFKVTSERAKEMSNLAKIRRLRRESIETFFYCIEKIESCIRCGFNKAIIKCEDFREMLNEDIEAIFKEVAFALTSRGWCVDLKETKYGYSGYNYTLTIKW
jgi:hypothetical protein